MAKEYFNANIWLEGLSQQPVYKTGVDSLSSSLTTSNQDIPPKLPAPFEIENETSEATQLLKNFLVSGWRGEDIISKTALSIKKIIHDLIPDAESVFLSNSNLNRSLKLLIYNEYLAFSKVNPLPPGAPDNYKDFWLSIQSENSPFAGYISRFTKIYSFRAVVCYLFRIRFITRLSQALSLELTENSLINPNSAIQKIFQKGSSTEIECESLQTNQYSWYRPSEHFKDKIAMIAKNFHLIGVEEIIKICINDHFFDEHNQLTDHYQHTQSNKNFGLFLNSLLVFFPYWAQGKKYPTDHQDSKSLKIKRCKYSGNNLSSLSLSHWLAQEENVKHKWELWSDLLCPQFQGDDFSDGNFVKICHELQFLYFLVELSIRKNVDPRKFISETIKTKYATENFSTPSGLQADMFSDFQINSEIVYDRIVLNLSELPKTNPHHALLGHITSNLNILKNNGYMFVFSNQKLFVPSQSLKMDQLLESCQIDANFDFEDLLGKGEIPNYLYVLSKKSPLTAPSTNNHFSNISQYLPKVNKYPCTSFRICGELSCFNKFREVVDELENFLLNSLGRDGHPVYFKELTDGVLFEYFQDAIVDGKLIHSLSKDSGNITHPSFFKNLTKSCLPLKSFFKIDSLDNESEKTTSHNHLSSELLGINDQLEDKHPLILIVHLSNPHDISLEIVSSSSYLAKVEEYGLALYKYFGLTPKTMDINVDLFRDFFNSNLGKQLISLSINSQSKLKSKLEQLLIPKFFSLPIPIPAQDQALFTLFYQDERTLKGHHPNDLKAYFDLLINEIEIYKNSHPYHICGMLVALKQKIHDIILEFNSKDNFNRKDYINYSNPLILDAILELPTFPIYPNSEDVFIQFSTDSSVMLNTQLSESRIIQNNSAGYLELISLDKSILKIYTDDSCLGLLKYIIDSCINMPILSILHNLEIPGINQLKKIIENFKEMETTLRLIHIQIEGLINKIFTEQISLHNNNRP